MLYQKLYVVRNFQNNAIDRSIKMKLVDVKPGTI